MTGKEYKDPALILQRKEENAERKSCSGCYHWATLWGMAVCRKYEGRAGAAVFMCPDFERKIQRTER